MRHLSLSLHIGNLAKYPRFWPLQWHIVDTVEDLHWLNIDKRAMMSSAWDISSSLPAYGSIGTWVEICGITTISKFTYFDSASPTTKLPSYLESFGKMRAHEVEPGSIAVWLLDQRRLEPDHLLNLYTVQGANVWADADVLKHNAFRDHSPLGENPSLRTNRTHPSHQAEELEGLGQCQSDEISWADVCNVFGRRIGEIDQENERFNGWELDRKRSVVRRKMGGGKIRSEVFKSSNDLCLVFSMGRSS